MWTDGQGARGRNPEKNQRDLITIRKAVKDEPQNPRYWFYLGQICETNGLIEEAIGAYGHRVTMSDYYEEIWYSRLRMAQLYVLQNQWPKAILNYLAAYEVDPTRAESLYWLALGYHNRGHDKLAMVFLEAVCLINQPVSALFVEDQVYQILRWIHYAVCLHNLGQHEDAQIMARKCLDSGKVPAEYKEALQRILQPEASALPETAAAVGQ
jgi:tetratricopeptide (TPR) repeat protein